MCLFSLKMFLFLAERCAWCRRLLRAPPWARRRRRCNRAPKRCCSPTNCGTSLLFWRLNFSPPSFCPLPPAPTLSFRYQKKKKNWNKLTNIHLLSHQWKKGLSIVGDRLRLDTRPKPKSRYEKKNKLVFSKLLFASRCSVVVVGAGECGQQTLCRAVLHRFSHIRIVAAAAVDLVASPGFLFLLFFFSCVHAKTAASPEHAVAALFSEISRAAALGPVAMWAWFF